VTNSRHGGPIPRTERVCERSPNHSTNESFRAALDDADVETITDDVSRLYALLDGAEGSRGEQTAARRRLERAGVDAETVRAEFVSYGAIRSYLTGHRDASLPEPDADARESESRTIEGLRQRTVAVTESKLARLRDTDHLQLGSYRVLADLQVLCEDCGRQYDVATLLETGACECGEQ